LPPAVVETCPDRIFCQTSYEFGLFFAGTSSYKADFLKIGSYLMAKKVSKRREWTPAQVRTLKSLARQKKHAAKIAKALKRTEGATRQKAFTLGLSLDSRA
jgi:tRNA U34 2-thiouridine synthase MnmA/TrmU